MKLFVSFIALAFAHSAFAVAASQEWVIRYVQTNALTTVATNASGATHRESGTGYDRVVVDYYPAVVHALIISNANTAAVSLGLTNGSVLVRNNAVACYGAQNAKVWADVNTNSMKVSYVCGALTSDVYRASYYLFETNGTRAADLLFTRITVPRALAITNGMSWVEVNQ